MNVTWHLGSKEIAFAINVATQLLPQDAFLCNSFKPSAYVTQKINCNIECKVANADQGISSK